MKKIFIVIAMVLLAVSLSAFDAKIVAHGDITKDTNIKDLQTTITNAANSVMDDVTISWKWVIDEEIHLWITISGSTTSTNMFTFKTVVNEYFSTIFDNARVDITFHDLYVENEAQE